MVVGYARGASSGHDRLQAQRDQLAAHGCSAIYEDEVLSSVSRRPGLEAAIAALRPGDVLVVTSLDRLAFGTRDLFASILRLGDVGAFLLSIAEGIDTRQQQDMRRLSRIMVEFDHHITRLRSAGLCHRAARPVGRPSSVDERAWARVSARIAAKELSPAEAARELKVGRSTVYDRLQKDRQAAEGGAAATPATSAAE